MKGLIGRKLGMTQIFNETGEAVPVTVIEAGPCYVTQIRTAEHDGYASVQLGFEPVKKATRLSKAERGHLGLLKADDKHAKRRTLAGEVPAVKNLRELRIKADENYTEGQKLTVDVFQLGERVDVVGTSKGRGFTGHVKRHGFNGGPGAHGSKFHRENGSVGTGAFRKIVKGTKMPGRMGNERLTVQNIRLFRVDKEKGLLLVNGAVPGRRGGMVVVLKATKK